MTIFTYYSTKDTVEGVINEFKTQKTDSPVKALVLFASVHFPQEPLFQAVSQLFNGSVVFGCSSAGEIVSGKMLKGGVVAMALDNDTLEDIHLEIVDHIHHENHVAEALKGLDPFIKAQDFEKYVGIILCDGMSGAEERLMDTLGNLTDIPFIGGSAGDDLQFKATYIYANGKVYQDAALLALLKLKNGFEILKTQSFCALNKTLKATTVDEARRLVTSFNGKPALQAYAEAIGATPEQAPSRFMSYPLGLMVGDEPYVRSPQGVNNQGMVFYCNIKEGMDLTLLQSTDIVEDTRNDLAAKLNELGGNVAGLINFHCILRTLELEQKGQTAAYGKLFENVPTIGFSTYGEEYIGHINQTSTILIFK